jgi:ESS family glutamate:Na+ symporter
VLSNLSVDYLGNFGKNTIKPLLWGFNFLFGTLFAILIKKIVTILKDRKIMNLTYINSYMMNRLSGLFFDIMIVAGIAAIDWQNLEGVLWPLIIVCTAGAIVTFLYLKFVCNKIYKGYEYEAFFAMFGMLTGTASTGMILLREIDPNYETPAADNLVLQGFPAIIFGAPIFLLVSFSAESFKNALITMGIVTVLFIVYNCITLRKYIFKRK